MGRSFAWALGSSGGFGLPGNMGAEPARFFVDDALNS